MKRGVLGAYLVAQAFAAGPATPAAAGPITVQQSSARNSVLVLQERSPFHDHESTVTAGTGRSTATEIIAIGPDPAPLSVTQAGAINRALIYQRGTAPNLDVRQSGALDLVRSRQESMP